MPLCLCVVFFSLQFPEVVPLNIGGAHFTTRLSTLRRYEDTMLAAMFSGRHYIPTDAEGRYFIDRDGTHFGYVSPSTIISAVLANEGPGWAWGLVSPRVPRRGENILTEFNKCLNGSKCLVSFPEETRTAGETSDNTHWLVVMQLLLSYVL